MDDQIPTAGEMLDQLSTLVARGLPCPISISLNREPRYVRRSSEIRLDNEDTAGVDQWAAQLGGTPQASDKAFTTPHKTPWRSYGFEVEFLGWDLHVWALRSDPAAPEGAGS